MRRVTGSQLSALEPLEALYAARGGALPRLCSVRPGDMPQPYRRLLVHASTMTSTLEGFLGQRLGLKVLHSSEEQGELRRLVVLRGLSDQRPAVLGAIRIQLGCFDRKARELLVQGHVPLGRLLAESQEAYHCHPELFFQTWSDSLMSEALGVEDQQPLFGRCNRLLEQGGRVMADVVEVLPLFQEEVPRRAAGE